MKYNFDQIIDRSGTNASKVEGYKAYIFNDPHIELPYADNEFIHLWVADMEFATAPEIIAAIEKRLDRKILGYTINSDSRLYDALNKWCKDRYDWTFDKKELVTSNGIVPAIKNLIDFITDVDEKILFNTPAYGQFALAAKQNDRDYVTSPMIYDGKGNYDIDFDDLDKKMADPKTKLFILCNPHNPTGKAYSKEELAKLAELIKKHDMWVISDEIHCDIRRADADRHIPLGKVMADYDKLITCMSTSKSFNIAGLAESSILIRNKELRDKWKIYQGSIVNPLSHEASIAAYNEAGDWLKSLTLYIDENFKFFKNFMAENLPEAIVTDAETTYLGWVDFTNYFEKDEDVELFFASKAGVLIEADKAFVDNANRMVRINLACPRTYLAEGLKKMADALNNNHNEKFVG